MQLFLSLFDYRELTQNILEEILHRVYLCFGSEEVVLTLLHLPSFLATLQQSLTPHQDPLAKPSPVCFSWQIWVAHVY